LLPVVALVSFMATPYQALMPIFAAEVFAGGAETLGFLIGGILGETIGLRATLVVAGIGPLLSIVWLVLSPVPGVREVPPPQGPEAVEAEVG